MVATSFTAVRVIDDHSYEGMKECISGKGIEGYSFVVINPQHPRCCDGVQPLIQKAMQEWGEGRAPYDGRFPRSVFKRVLQPVGIPDYWLNAGVWRKYCIGRVSDWIDPDSDDPCVRTVSEKALVEELMHFSYLRVRAIVVQLRGVNQPNLVRIINQYFENNNQLCQPVWVQVPLVPRARNLETENIAVEERVPRQADLNESSATAVQVYQEPRAPPVLTRPPPRLPESKDTWDWVYHFRTACKNNPHIHIILEVTEQLPDDCAMALERWWGEPLVALHIRTDLFFTSENKKNDDGYSMPKLPAEHERVIQRFMQANVSMIVEGPVRHGPSEELLRRRIRRVLDEDERKLALQADAKKRTSQERDERLIEEQREASKLMDYLQRVDAEYGGRELNPFEAERIAQRLKKEDEENRQREREAAKSLAAALAADLNAARTSEEVASAVELVPKRCIYLDYLEELFQTKPPRDTVTRFAKGYEDFLQTPLQPLGDNLESQVYETFEKDPVKYKYYGRAFKLALDDKSATTGGSDKIVVMVLGAGRGPLVTECYKVLKASEKYANSFKLYAVEKNVNAIVTLNWKLVNVWNNEVEVVCSDMREFHPPNKADIVVSELLGSFGDNELSPECLDGALHLMKDDCISIPQSYSSYIGPLHSPKLNNEINKYADLRNPKTSRETSYVVRVFNRFEMAPPVHLFQFDHPNNRQTTNDRSGVAEFIVRETSELMGFVGYFTAKLYGDIELSIVPSTYTKEMFSWFPILFPIPYPILIKRGERIKLHFWRRSNERQVWYEWRLSEPVCTPMSNPGGRSHAIRLII